MLSFSHGFGWAFQETRGTAIWPASHSLSKTSLRQAIPLSYPVQRIFVSCFQVRKGIGPSKWAKNPWGYSTVIMLPHIPFNHICLAEIWPGERAFTNFARGGWGNLGPFPGRWIVAFDWEVQEAWGLSKAFGISSRELARSFPALAGW